MTQQACSPRVGRAASCQSDNTCTQTLALPCAALNSTLIQRLALVPARGGKPVCCVSKRPRTGELGLAPGVATVEFLRRALW